MRPITDVAKRCASSEHLGAGLVTLLTIIVIFAILFDNPKILSHEVLPTGDLAAQSAVTHYASRLRAIYGIASWNNYFQAPTLDYLRALFIFIPRLIGFPPSLSAELASFHFFLFLFSTIFNYYAAYHISKNTASALCFSLVYVIFFVSFGQQNAQLVVVPWQPYSATLVFSCYVLCCAAIVGGNIRFIALAILFGSICVHSVLAFAPGILIIFIGSVGTFVSLHGSKSLWPEFRSVSLYVAVLFAVYPLLLDWAAGDLMNSKKILQYVSGNIGKQRPNAADAWAIFSRFWSLTAITNLFILTTIAAALTMLLANVSAMRKIFTRETMGPFLALLIVGILASLAAFFSYRYFMPVDYVAFHIGLYGRIGLLCIFAAFYCVVAASLSGWRRISFVTMVVATGVVLLAFPRVGYPSGYKVELNPHWLITSTLASEVEPILQALSGKEPSISLAILFTERNSASSKERAYHPWLLTTAIANLLHRHRIEFCVTSRPAAPGFINIMADYTISRICIDQEGDRAEATVGWSGDRAVLRVHDAEFIIQ